MRIQNCIILLGIAFSSFSFFHEKGTGLSYSAEFVSVETTAVIDTSNAPLTTEILITNTWSERLKEQNCEKILKFETEGKGHSWGCALVKTLEFQYEVRNDTLIVVQYEPFPTSQPAKKWMGGKYIYSGNSLILVEATEWDKNGKPTNVELPRHIEYLQRDKD